MKQKPNFITNVFLIIIFLILIFTFLGCATTGNSTKSSIDDLPIPIVTPPSVPPWQPTVNSKRIVAYFPTWDNFDNVMQNNLDFKVISYVNIAFVNPDGDGNLVTDFTDDQIHTLVDEAHNSNAKVLISIGGGDGPDYSNFIKPDALSGFVSKIIQIIDKFNLDGLDVDIEGQQIIDHSSDYNNLIVASHTALTNDNNKLLSAALSDSWTGAVISDEVISQFDFINIMAYDDNWGSYTPHSSYQFAVDLLDYWVNDRKLSPEKACLGVPFYGYNGKVGENEMYYKEIIKKWPYGWNKDQAGLCTYNGANTIAMKTQYARYYGGVMIWAISQDTVGNRSLLKVIDANNF